MIRAEATLAYPEKVVESFSDPQARLSYRFYVGNRVMEKVDEAEKILGLSILKVSALKRTPLEFAL